LCTGKEATPSATLVQHHGTGAASPAAPDQGHLLGGNRRDLEPIRIEVPRTAGDQAYPNFAICDHWPRPNTHAPFKLRFP